MSVRILAMPEISRFYGIIIRMYFDDHDPLHFHAIYGGDEGQVVLIRFGRYQETCLAA